MLWNKKQENKTENIPQAKQQLLTAEALLETMIDGLVVVDVNGNIIQCNNAYARMHKFTTCEEMIGINLSELVAEKDKKKVMDDVKRSLETGISSNFEHVSKDKTGKEFFVLVNASAIRDEVGKVVEMVAVVRDITELKKTKDAAWRASMQRYRCIFESSRDAIMTLEPPFWRFTSGNPATIKMFRVKDEAEFTTCEPWRLSPQLQPDGRPSAEKAKEMIETAVREGSNFFEWTHQRVNGEVFFAEVLLSRIDLGKQIFLQAVVRDITERKKTEDSMRRLIAIVELTGDSIIGIDLNGAITEWNNSAEHLYGYSRKEILGKNRSILVPKEYKDELDTLMQDIKKGQYIKHLETLRQKKDGTIFPVSMTISVINDSYGNVCGASSITRDITERKKAEASMRRLATIVKSSIDAIISKDLNGIVIDCNKSAELLYGYNERELIGKNISILVPKERMDEFNMIMQKLKKGQHISRLETLRQKKNGMIFPVSLTVSPINDEYGNVCGAATIVRDITEVRQADKAIKESEARFRSIVFLSQEAILVVDAEGKIGYINPAAWKIFNLEVGDFIGDRIGLPIINDKFIEINILRPGKDPGVGEMHVTATEWMGKAGHLIMVHDITEQKYLLNKLQQSEKRLKWLAEQDILTSLPNRYQFMQIADKNIAYATRHNTTLAALLMDLDKFKEVNDTYGHDVGDLLLKEVAARILACSRKEDFVARLGGDEFIMLAVGIKNPKDASIIAQKILEAIKQKYVLNGHEIHISISIGVAFFPTGGDGRETLFKKADIAMYMAKHAGKDRYQIYEDLR